MFELKKILVLGLIISSRFLLACNAQEADDSNADGPTKYSFPYPKELPADMGVATIPDRATYDQLSYQGTVRMDEYLNGLHFVKFIVWNAMSDDPLMYWMNTRNIQAHPQFMGRLGMPGGPGGRGRGGPNGGGPNAGGERIIPREKVMRGAVTYLPRLRAPDGTAGLYIFDFQPNDNFAFEQVKFVHDVIVDTMPFVKGKIAFHPLEGNVATYQREKSAYADGGLPVYEDKDVYGDIAFLPLNPGVGFGRLRMMDKEISPSPRDILICESLPNQLPRVGGVLSLVRQTPLSHVNLRAIQDNVPNAFVDNALANAQIKQLVGKLVRYEVTSQGYSLREATMDELEQHFAKLRPLSPPVVSRDLSKTQILPLNKFAFSDASSIGVKAANIAAMQTFELPAGTIPDGMAIPFYFYDEYMKHNGFYESIAKTISDPEFQTNRDKQEEKLEDIQKMIKKGDMPSWMMDAIATAQQSFPPGFGIRCRSSTNNEDLAQFSGAGLYDSYTHRADEGHLAKTVKQVYASLWNFRAFEEREFYRIDHLQVAMGVLMHPNFDDEQANGVAVTDDVLYETKGNYYINVQAGEDLVTNPDEQSAPEEVLLGWYQDDGFQIVRQASPNKQLLSPTQLDQLRQCLARIHGRFRELYGKSDTDKFAMEVEFKIDKNQQLVIKQARPWIY